LNTNHTDVQKAERKAYAQAMYDAVTKEPQNFYAYATGKTDIDVYYAY
jgi:hypothetical protein